MISHLQPGQYNVNKTWKYLLPMLQNHGEIFKAKVSNVFKVAAGISDGYYKQLDDRCIFLLIDTLTWQSYYKNTSTWLRHQPYYVDDYPFDDVLAGRRQMFIIRIPEEFNESYDEFLFSRYSRMYTEEQIDKLYGEDSRHGATDVLRRTTTGYMEFMDKIENSFGTKVKKSDLAGAELDFPIEPEKEIFNYEPANK